MLVSMTSHQLGINRPRTDGSSFLFFRPAASLLAVCGCWWTASRPVIPALEPGSKCAFYLFLAWTPAGPCQPPVPAAPVPPPAPHLHSRPSPSVSRRESVSHGRLPDSVHPQAPGHGLQTVPVSARVQLPRCRHCKGQRERRTCERRSGRTRDRPQRRCLHSLARPGPLRGTAAARPVGTPLPGHR